MYIEFQSTIYHLLKFKIRLYLSTPLRPFHINEEDKLLFNRIIPYIQVSIDTFLPSSFGDGDTSSSGCINPSASDIKLYEYTVNLFNVHISGLDEGGKRFLVQTYTPVVQGYGQPFTLEGKFILVKNTGVKSFSVRLFFSTPISCWLIQNFPIGKAYIFYRRITFLLQHIFYFIFSRDLRPPRKQPLLKHKSS